ncbi:MAG TPA: isochorismatase family protein [Thermohalobaculum sp.]|nr:isochorismatase family protein [Thermohalobaculum sp.]
MRPWNGVITDEEERRYRAAGFGRPGSVGQRPALLIIDVQYRTVGTLRKPYWEAIKEYPTACGEDGWRAVDHIQPLLAEFRQRGLPVLYPHVAPKNADTDAGRLAEKVPAIMGIDVAGYRFVEELAPVKGDVLLPKKHPSAFFGTPLVSHLIDLGVDTLFVTGCTTSGCVRSSVADAFAYNFKVVVPEECVYDRSPTSHAVNLWDMNAKYADVMPVAEAIALLPNMQTERTGT